MNAQMRDVTSGLWAIDRADLRGLVRQAAMQMRQIPDLAAARAEHVQALQGQIDDPRVQLVGSVAVIPICGAIFNRGNIWSYLFGGAVISVIRAQLRKALADESVKAILLHVDSPGGVTDGVPEFAAEIFKSRGIKPITAVSDTMMCSAGYWISSGADEIIASPSSFNGSIGVFCEHEDLSKLLEAEGISIEVIASDAQKVEDHFSKPLSDEAKSHKQAIVDQMAGMFFADVARARGVTVTQVKNDFGRGRAFLAKESQKMGLVDRVATFEETVARLTGGTRRRTTSATTGGTMWVMGDDMTAEETEAAKIKMAKIAALVTTDVVLEPAEPRLALAPEAETPSPETPAVPDQAAVDLERCRLVLARTTLNLETDDGEAA